MSFKAFATGALVRRLRGLLLGMFLGPFAAPLWLAIPAAHAADAAASCPPAPRPIEAAEAEAAMRTAQDRGYLWRIDKGGHASWLYGTIHLGERDWVFPGPTIQSALRGADRIALELDMLEPSLMAKMAVAVAAKPGAPALPADLQRRLKAQFDAACAGTTLLTLRPEMQAMSLLALAGRAQGLDPAFGIDATLSGIGHAVGKPVLSLETLEQQMAALLSDDPAEVQALVAETLESLEKNQAQPTLRRLANAWAASRLDDLTHYADWCDCMNKASERAAYEKLIDDRNPGLARGVAAIHDEGRTVFAAVGALHMVGDRGVPALLAGMGFKVERVPFAALRVGTNP